MALLKSVDNVPGLDFYEYRDQPFYGKYDYRLRIKIPCVRYAYWCKTPEELDNKLAGKGYGSVLKADRQLVTDNLDALKSVVELQNTRKSMNLGLRVEGITVAVFGNHLPELQSVASKFTNNYEKDFSQAQTSDYAGIKYFVNEPEHKYRVYLKSRRIEKSFYYELADMFKRMPGLFPSVALQRWLKHSTSWRWQFTSSGHFIDYDDESTLSYLALMHGDMLGKKYKLEKRPDIV